MAFRDFVVGRFRDFKSQNREITKSQKSRLLPSYDLGFKVEALQI